MGKLTVHLQNLSMHTPLLGPRRIIPTKKKKKKVTRWGIESTYWIRSMYKILNSSNHLDPFSFLTLNFNCCMKDQFKFKGAFYSNQCIIHERGHSRMVGWHSRMVANDKSDKVGRWAFYCKNWWSFYFTVKGLSCKFLHTHLQFTSWQKAILETKN